jgi:murein L,D-transpeptidase YcbB/YkuD
MSMTPKNLSRRHFLRQASLLGGGIAALSMISGHAQAQSAMDFFLQEQIKKQSGWDSRFDDGARNVVPVLSNEPMFSPASSVNLERAIRQYQDMITRGGWPYVPADKVLSVGMRDANVAVLRQRLIASDDLQQRGGGSDVFDSFVVAALKRFQTRHGIEPTGVADAQTFQALNTPIGVRIRQLEANLARVKDLANKNWGERYVMVNIPAASLEAVNAGYVTSRHTAIVGKIDRQTPILSSKIHELNFNPYWTVPVSIIKKDLIPKMQEDPGYLERNNIRIFDWRTQNELSPREIDWNTDQATQYMFRQDPGEINSLGTVKINFHNKHSVYLHDTPTKSLFGQNDRFLSSGCVRVQNVRELITWILKGQEDWNRAKIDALIASGERLDTRVEQPVPLHLEYVTAWASSTGIVNFREDIYNRDGISALIQNASNQG